MANVTDSPDILPPPIISQFIAAPSDSTPGISKQRRKRKRRGRQQRAVRGPATGDEAVSDGVSDEEEYIDEQKHSRAMDVMYHLQQRLEQLSSIIQTVVSGECVEVTAVAMNEELKAIGDALTRLLRIFRIAKDELNSSQYFPGSRVDNCHVTRKQLLLNTRLRTCNRLVKMHQELEDLFAEHVNDLHDESIGSRVPAEDDGDSLGRSAMLEKSLLELENSVMSTHSASAIEQSLPFQNPLYSDGSQDVQSQSDLFGDVINPNSARGFMPANNTRHSQSTFVAFHGKKVFASPPPKYLLQEPHSLDESAHFETNTSVEGSGIAGDSNTSQAFEPSQQLLLLQESQPEPPPVRKSLAPLAIAATEENIFMRRPTAMKATQPPPTKTKPSAMYKKLVISPSMKVRVINNTELTSMDREADIKQLFNGTTTGNISDKLVKTLETWML